MMLISRPRTLQEGTQIIYRVDVKSTEGERALWYSLDESFGGLLSNSSDAFLLALLIPAMATGEDIHIDGTISERLWYNLSGSYQSLVQRVIPFLRRVAIHPEHVCCDHTGPASGVATGFSGGIDSYCVLADHYFSQVSEGFKITHLLFNNVGSHGPGGRYLFHERYRRLLSVTERIQLPFVMIDSNLDSFYDEKLGFQQTHTPRNASVALLLQGGIGRYMYASAYSYSEAFVGPTYAMGYSDTIALPLLSTETLDALSVGSEYTRVEKTLRVAEIPESHTTLDVCVKVHSIGHTNCSTCWKCLRTLATLEIAGCLERYSASFDLDAYRIQRNRYFANLIGSHDPLLVEIVDFANNRNYSFPVSSHLLHLLSRVIHAPGIYSVARLSRWILLRLKHVAVSLGRHWLRDAQGAGVDETEEMVGDPAGRKDAPVSAKQDRDRVT